MTLRLRPLLVLAIASAVGAGCTSPSPARPAPAAPSASPTGAVAPAIPRAASATTGSTAPPSAILPGRINRTSLGVRASYDVRVRLNYGTGRLYAVSYMSATNISGAGIDRLELNTVLSRVGSLWLSSVTVDGRRVAASVSEQTIRLRRGGVLPPGATVRVRIAFSGALRTTLTGRNWYFTRYNGIVNAYRWLPWISRATPFPGASRGDPFVTTTSPSVRVVITTDRPMPMATSGRRIAVSGLTQTFVASNVRDFNFTASPYYRATAGYVGKTRVTVWYRSGAPGSTMLYRARWALSRFNSLVGPYPYPTYTVAQSAGGIAMESPGHIWIPPVSSTRLAYLVTHETAHQWFYSLVGNDQAREPFADEAMADFITRYALSSFRGSRCSSNRLDLSIYSYSAGCYFEVVYVKGANVLNSVRARMGSSAFWAAVREYARTYGNRLSRTGWLLRFFDDRTPVDLRPLYRIYFPSIYPS